MSPRKQTAPNLRAVAERVGLAPCSVSSVLNNAPAARAIPQSTKERIFQAAAELNYRPNFWARSLRTKRTRMVAAITPDFGYPAAARVIAAAQERLQIETGASPSTFPVEPKLRPSFDLGAELSRSSSRRSLRILREVYGERPLPPSSPRNAAESAEA